MAREKHIGTHSIGNGAVCVYVRGADWFDIMAPYYSTPTLLRLTQMDNAAVRVQRETGTAIYTYSLEGFGSCTDCTVGEHPAILRQFDCKKPVSFRLEAGAGQNLQPLHPSLLEGDYTTAVGGHIAAGTLFYVNWRNADGSGQGYPIPDRLFFAAAVSGDGRFTLEGDAAKLTITKGALLVVCERTEQDAIALLQRLCRQSPQAIETDCRAGWRRFTQERLRHQRADIEPEVAQAADDIAVLLKTQQDAGGGILAGCNYHLSYVRDNYGGFRGLMATGCYAEAKKLLRYYAQTLSSYGAIHTAQGMGCFAFHVHEHDFAENTGYLILMALEYYEQTGCGETLQAMLPVIRWALCKQREALHNGVLPFSGDETYIAGGILPRSCIGDGSMEATLLYHRALERFLPLAKAQGLLDTAEWEAQAAAKERIEATFATHFLSGGTLYCNAPDTWRNDERMRPGVMECLHGFGTGYRNAEGRFVCADCLRSGKVLPPAEKKRYTLLSTAFVPLFVGSTLVPESVLRRMVDEAVCGWQETGRLPSAPDGDRTVGYDYGMLLYAMKHLSMDSASIQHFTDCTLSMRDDRGAWVEYYDAGMPAGTPCRAWESAVNITALLQ